MNDNLPLWAWPVGFASIVVIVLGGLIACCVLGWVECPGLTGMCWRGL